MLIQTNITCKHSIKVDKAYSRMIYSYIDPEGLIMSEIEDQLEDQEIKSMNDNLGTILYIMLGRIYDQLTLIADAQGKGEDMMKLMELHRQGHLMSPIPTLALPEAEKE